MGSPVQYNSGMLSWNIPHMYNGMRGSDGIRGSDLVFEVFLDLVNIALNQIGIWHSIRFEKSSR